MNRRAGFWGQARSRTAVAGDAPSPLAGSAAHLWNWQALRSRPHSPVSDSINIKWGNSHIMLAFHSNETSFDKQLGHLVKLKTRAYLDIISEGGISKHWISPKDACLR